MNTALFQEETEIASQIAGVVPALVEDTQDPQGIGRVKVTFPLMDGKVVSNWVRVASFFAGPDRGAFFLPKKGDEVLVSFAYGNTSMPFVIGLLWNGKDKPPVKKSDQQDVREIKTSIGQVVRFEEGKNQRITITDKAYNQIVIDSKKDALTVICDGTMTVRSKKGKVQIKGKTISIDADSSLSLSGSRIDIKAKSTLTLKGSRININ